MHSGIDLLASFSVRRAEEPADASHRYGHEKFENAAAAAEGMLILAGSAVIAFAAISALIHGSHLDHLGVGIVVIGLAGTTNLAVGAWLFRKARETFSPALEGDAAHPPHRAAHQLQDAIQASVRGADVLIPIEPEDRVRAGEVLPGR